MAPPFLRLDVRVAGVPVGQHQFCECPGGLKFLKKIKKFLRKQKMNFYLLGKTPDPSIEKPTLFSFCSTSTESSAFFIKKSGYPSKCK
jgi:hypothetical protein